jgi:CelD/BcsL family acetyltransferase involved in cellulose biosynthesis
MGVVDASAVSTRAGGPAYGGSVATPLAIEIAAGATAFDELREDWRTLHDADPNATVFCSWEWTATWWRHYGKGQPLRIVTIRADGQLVGVGALYVQRQVTYAGMTARVLRWVGTGGDTSPDDLGPLFRPDRVGEACAAFCDALLAMRDDWDVALLTDLDEAAVFWTEMQSRARRQTLRVTLDTSAEISFVELPPSWDAYLATLSRDRRYAVRSARRKAESGAGAQFTVVTSGVELERAYDQLVSLHRRRWSARGVADAFSSTEYVEFHREAVRACAACGWIRFYVLSSADAPMAMFYCYRFRDRVFYFQAGFDPSFERLRPGMVLMGHAIEHAIAERNDVFDYLRGEHEYKTQWGKGRRRTGTLTVYSRGWRAGLFHLRDRSVPMLKQSLKDRAPWLVGVVRRVRGLPPDGHA